jgi:hypothetical protein
MRACKLTGRACAAAALLAALWLMPTAVTAQNASAPAEPRADATSTAPATQPAQAMSADQAATAPMPAQLPAQPAVVVKKSQPKPAPRLDVVKLTGVSFAGGAAATVIAVPIALLVGSLIGSLPPNLFAAAVPAVLIAGLVPPVLVAGSEWLLQAWLGSDAGSFWWAWGATTLVHVGALVVGALLGVSTANAVTLAGLVGVEALLLPTTATATLLLTKPEVESEK